MPLDKIYFETKIFAVINSTYSSYLTKASCCCTKILKKLHLFLMKFALKIVGFNMYIKTYNEFKLQLEPELEIILFCNGSATWFLQYCTGT